MSGGLLTIFSSYGDIRYEAEWATGQQELIVATESWVPGWYAIRLNLADRLITGRFLVQR